MTKIIIHGGYTKVENETNKGFIKEVAEGLPNGFKILVIFFAINEDRYKDEFEKYKEIFLKYIKQKGPVFILATKENFEKQIKEADVIYLRGGDTVRLLDTLKEYDNFKNIIKDKVVAGSSAGAYVLSKYFYNNDTDTVHEGLGILPIRLRCHYKGEIKKVEEKFSEFPDSLKYKLVLLEDFEYKIYEL